MNPRKRTKGSCAGAKTKPYRRPQQASRAEVPRLVGDWAGRRWQAQPPLKRLKPLCFHPLSRPTDEYVATRQWSGATQPIHARGTRTKEPTEKLMTYLQRRDGYFQ
jgi:hypothetical protein